MWYYSLLGKSLGPVSDDEFQRLVADGTITPDTAVWNENMTDWKAYKEVAPAGGMKSVTPVDPFKTSTTTPASVSSPLATVSSPAAAAADPYKPVDPAPAAASGTYYPDPNIRTSVSGTQGSGLVTLNPQIPGQAYCAECRRSYPESEVVRIKGQPICANCKPAYMQKVREGVITAGAGVLNLAHPGYRILARLVDGLISLVLMFIFAIPTIIAFVAMGDQSPVPIIIGVISYLAWTLGMFVYIVYFTVAWGGTPGKYVLGLKVVTPDGANLTWGRSIGRFFATMVTDMTCTIGYLWAFFDDQSRALHDMICDTRVIKS